MGRHWWRRPPHLAAVGSPAWRGTTAFGGLAILAAGGLLHYIPGPPRGDAGTGTVQTAAAFQHIVLPDLAVIQSSGISDAGLAQIHAIKGIQQFISLDGAAVTSGGAFSVRLVPVMGICFLALGVLAFVFPEGDGSLFMAAGFGGLQIGFGLIIARKYGG